MTRFAVIITSYNYRAFVVEAVDSALAQTRAAAQVIVVDDGSTDGSPELLRARYAGDPRVTLLIGENGGQLVAFQRGVTAVDADVVCFLDADDRWQPDYLEKIGAVYDQRRDVDFVFSDLNLFDRETGHIAYADRATDLGYTAISTYACMHWYGAPTSALSLRSDFARQALQLPATLARIWKLSADNCLVYGASIYGARKYFLPTGAVGYRIHGNNGWWANRNPTSRYLNRLHSRGLITHYAGVMGMDRSCLALAKWEFRTKPDPDREEIRRYMGLCWRAPLPWWKRLELVAGVMFGRRR